MSYLYWLLIVEVSLLILSCCVTSMDFTSPSFITVIVFIIATLSIIYNKVYWRVTFTKETFLLVSLGLFTIVFVEMIIKTYYNLNVKRDSIWIDQKEFIEAAPYYVPNHLKVIFLMFSTVCMITYVIGVIKTSGMQAFSVQAIGVVHLDEELEVGTVGNIAGRISKVICFPSLFIFLHNIIKYNKSVRQNIWLLIPVINSCIYMFFSGARSMYLSLIIAALFYSVIFRRFKLGWYKVKIKKYIVPIIIMAFIMTLVFVGTRDIVKNKEYTTTPLQYLTYYIGSPLYLFDKIIHNTQIAFPVHYKNYPGYYTFTWLYSELKKIGIINYQFQDVQFVYIGGSFKGGGNVYTIFSNPYHDFGLIGMLIFIALFYGLYCVLYYKYFRYNRKISKSIIPLLMFGNYYYFVVLSFYTAMTVQFRTQIILEMIISMVVFGVLTGYISFNNGKLIIKKEFIGANYDKSKNNR